MTAYRTTLLALLATMAVQNGRIRATAQGPVAASAARDVLDGDLMRGNSMARFRLVQGRLCLDAPRHRKGSQSRHAGEVFESVSVTAVRGLPSVHYVYRSPKRQLTISIDSVTDLRLESYLADCDERSVIRQQAGAPIAWTIRRDGKTHSFDGETLLHVRAGDPPCFDRHHASVLRRLLRGLEFDALCERTCRSALEQCRHDEALPSLEEVESCVERLASCRQRQRSLAERELRSWGTPVLPMLIAIGAKSPAMDPETRMRLRRVAETLRPERDDTAASLSRLLVNDASYWQRVVGDLPSADRAALAAHGRRIGWQADPDAPEAVVASR